MARAPTAGPIRDALAIAAFAAAWLALLVRTPPTLFFDLGAALAAAAAAFAGVLAADLASGLVHFTCDRFFSPTTPVIGPLFIAPFRDHHVDPEGIARHGLLERSGNNCLAALPLVAGVHLGLDPEPGSWLASAAHAFMLTFSLALAATNEIHALAHRPRVPAWVARLQRARLILSPHAHQQHHSAEHASAYCITTGWLNPPLDRLHVFARIERAIRGRWVSSWPAGTAVTATLAASSSRPRRRRSRARGASARRSRPRRR